MPKAAEYVHFNNGSALEFALVVGTSSEDASTLDLISFDPHNAVPQHRNGVPRREPADYGPEGGGDTWCEPA